MKIRGYRVEPGEIEAVLAQHPVVREALVVVREDQPGQRRLVAYLVAVERVPTAELRAFVQARLPDYMVPAAWVFLAALPLTPSGKRDRQRLPSPDATTDSRSVADLRSPVEVTLAQIWTDTLGLPTVSRNDDFFALGGHSLNASQVIWRIRETFGVALAHHSIFAQPRLADLAVAITAAGAGQAPPIVKQPSDAPAPLSSGQLRLWFLDQLLPNPAAYHMPWLVRIDGALDPAALAASLQVLLDRHAALRTRFRLVGEQPVQLVLPALLPLEQHDLRGAPAAALEQLLIAEARRPFDLARDLLVRGLLVRHDEAAHTLLVTMHHSVADGWSLDVLYRELLTLYAAHTSGQSAQLPEQVIQYSDFAHWQRTRLDSPQLEAQRAYWLTQLAGAPALLELPSDRPRPAEQQFDGATEHFHLPPALVDQLRVLGQRAGCTLFMTLLAAFQTLLYRYTRQDDIVVGSPVANRTRAELRDLVGFLVNTLVLRCDLSGNPSFRTLLGRVRQVCLAAYAHQDVPFERLVESLQPDRNPSHTPVFQVMFALWQDSLPTQRAGAADWTMHDLPLGAAQFDLSLDLTKRAGGLDGTLEYRTDLFDTATIARMAGHFQVLLASLLAEPDRRIAELPILGAAEQATLLDWGGRGYGAADARPVHQHVAERAARTPDAVAMVANGQRLTYGALDAQANRLAEVLRAGGVAPGALVAICLERGPEVVIAVLGVLKAGAAYLPLESAYPAARRQQMLEQARPVATIAAPASAGRPPLVAGLPLELTFSGAPLAGERPAADLDDLAYVIYTSGSTGQPKGVQISHRNLASALAAWQECYGPAEGRVHLQMASFAFDVFVSDLVRTLCTGGTLVLCPRETLLEPAALYALMQREQIDSADFVPAVLRVLAAYLEETGQRLDAMRLLICGSDSWYLNEYARIRRLCGPQTRLVNAYGLTETTIDSTIFEAATVAEAGEQLVPLGRPLSNTQLYLLDAQMRLVPTGVPGELYIGGAGLARGYLGRADLTAERFVPNPFATPQNEMWVFQHEEHEEHEGHQDSIDSATQHHVAMDDHAPPQRHAAASTSLKPQVSSLWHSLPPLASRLYHTGDLGRYRADGTVEFLGRADGQVKLRGYRIEPGEIEALLRQHPLLLDVAVVLQTDHASTPRLVAFVVSKLLPSRVPVQGSCLADDGVRTVELPVEDISANGIGVRAAPSSWLVGQRVQVRLQMEGPAAGLVLPGRVAWLRDGQAGLALELGEHQQRAVRQQLDHLLDTGGTRRMLQRVLSDTLSEFLREKLPSYMVPTAWVMVEALPQNANGKLDRRALRGLTTAEGTLALHLPPRSAIEAQLAEIWAGVLGLPEVGVEDNFFALGGHSLLAMQIITRVRRQFLVDLPLRVLFESPTIAGMAAQIAVMQLHLRALPHTIPAIGRAGPLPLSFAQQRLWLAEQLADDTALYAIVMAVRLRGVLDLPALTSSLQAIVQRHEVLRTSFDVRAGQLVQQIAPAHALPLPLLDLLPAGGAARAAALAVLIQEESQRPFDLANGPLLRATLIKQRPQEHMLLLALHHTVADEWSMTLFFDELAAGYTAALAGQPVGLPELPVQYADFAHWQRQWLQGAVLERLTAYWTERLAGAPTVLQLPYDLPRPAVATFRSLRYQCAISPALTASLQALGQRENVTLFMTLLAAFQVLLGRYSGQHDFLIGTPITDRPHPALERLIGLFVNTLVLRADLAGQPSFVGLLERVRQSCLEAFTHQDLPFEQLLAALPIARDAGYHPLFQIMFVFQNGALEPRQCAGLTLEPHEVEERRLQFDLVLEITRDEQELQAIFHYASDLFVPATIAAMSEHFLTLLAGIVADPTQPITQLPLLSQAERQRQLVDWNATAQPLPAVLTAADLFDRQAQAQPDALALVAGDMQLSYAALAARANQLAHHLRTRGVGPEQLVGICVARSIELVVAALGVLKAGAAYLPLDPAYPAARLALMLEDAQPTLVLVSAASAAGEAAGGTGLAQLSDAACPVIDLQGDWPQIREQAATSPVVALDPANLAYVIYTSGSTGRPKGVLLQHGGLVNLALAQIAAFAIDPSSRLLQFASFSFDAAVSEIFTALLVGATLVLAPQSWQRALGDLTTLLDAQAITHVTLPPSLLALLPSAGLRSLRTVVSAGEHCGVEIARRWSVGRRFINAYGPTEATIGPALQQVTQIAPDARHIPIGRPIANTQIYLLDAAMQPVPVGVTGELYIGGLGVARGYLRQPALVAERFVPNPFATPVKTPDFQHEAHEGHEGHEDQGNFSTQRPAALGNHPTSQHHAAESTSPKPQASSLRHGLRLYRTGDLARFRPDGTLEYLGRSDAQLKVRGFRIEPGEIEAALRQHPLVRDAVVLGRPDGLGDTQLLAYAVPAPTRAIELWPSVAEFYIYDQLLYYAMTHDELRNQCYRTAISQLVRDRVVLDIGTGPDAILARLCVEAGARRVYAVELLETTYRAAQQTLAQHGLTDLITLIHGDATQISLPEPIDVCVSEIVGAIGGAEGAARILNEARRHLAPTGRMIPARSLTLVAAVMLPDQLLAQPGFSPMTAHYVGQIFEQVGQPFDLRLAIKGLEYADLLSDCATFEDLDFSGPVALEQQHAITLTIGRAGRLDGLLVWLTLETIAGTWLDTLAHQHCWLPVFLPLGEAGLLVQAGDRLVATITRRLCENGLNPDFVIEGQLQRVAGMPVGFHYTAHHIAPGFRQNPFYARLFAEGIPIQSTADAAPRASTLRDYLAQRLPPHMLPAAVVLLDALPLTPNGKIDRAALPSPMPAGAAPPATSAPPRSAVEATLARLWAETLGLAQVGIHDDFFALGGHSLRALVLLHQIGTLFPIDLPLHKLFAYPTVAGFAGYLATALRGAPPDGETLDLHAEAVLDPAICAPGHSYTWLPAPRALLLTGATGFLGAYLLYELLWQTTASIYCLVRAASPAEGHARIMANLQRYGLNATEWHQRIIPLLGDLAQPRLGLTAEVFAELAGQLDGIYHNGGAVHFVQPYASLRAANVLGTQEVIRLACQQRSKPLHFISTLGVYSPDTYLHRSVDEQEAPDDPAGLHFGYEQSKWVADRMVRHAQDCGLPVVIYRPARITGDSRSGATNLDDFTCRLIKGCIELGQFPDRMEPIDMLPVDYLSQAIVYLSRQPSSLGRPFHFFNTPVVPFEHLAGWLRAHGYRLERAPFELWRANLDRQVRAGVANALAPLLPLFWLDTFDPTVAQFTCEATFAALQGLLAPRPVVDDRLIETYVAHMIQVGFLNAPER